MTAGKKIPYLKKKLDEVFSTYIRLRDADKNGNCRCISCGNPHPWKYTDCGHYYSRVYASTRYDEQNCNAQCMTCNRVGYGNRENYARALISKYGIKVLSDLEERKNEIRFMKSSDYEFLIDHYKEKAKVLRKEKQL